jgi:von Hippel-Lindau disease tumor suppressor protein
VLYARAMRRRRSLVWGVALTAVVTTASLATSAEAAPARAASVCHITQTRSLTGTAKTVITFSNKRGTPIQLYWLDYKGHLVYYNTVAPDTTLAQPTFKTHVWLVLDPDFKCVGYVIAPKATYVVT